MKKASRMPRPWLGRAIVLGLGAFACSETAGPPPAPGEVLDAGGGAGSTGSSAGSEGGADDRGGGELEGGRPGGTAGARDGTPSEGEGGAGGADQPPPPTEPIDGACVGRRAFVATSGAFVPPTGKALALALNAATYGASPITFALFADSQPVRAAASYSVKSGQRHSFPPSLAIEPTPAWLALGGFGSLTAQGRGYLQLATDDGPLELPLDNVSFTVSTADDCTRGVARLTGVIPEANADLIERLSGAGGAGAEGEADARPAAADTPIEAVFSVESVDFEVGRAP